jgi:hypothetical protein
MVDGSPFNDGNSYNAGHVRIFEWKDGAWAQLGDDADKLHWDDASFEQ